MWGMHSDLYSPDVFGGKVTNDTLCDLSWATPEHHWSVDVLKHNITLTTTCTICLRPLIQKGPGKYCLHMYRITELCCTYQ